MAKWKEIWSKCFEFHISLKDENEKKIIVLRFVPLIWVFLIFIIILHPYLVILKILFGQYIYFVYLQCPRKRSKIYFGAHSLKALTTSHRQNKHTQRMRKIITFKHFVHLWHSSIVWLWTHTEWSLISIILWFCCILDVDERAMCKKNLLIQKYILNKTHFVNIHHKFNNSYNWTYTSTNKNSFAFENWLRYFSDWMLLKIKEIFIFDR